MSETKCSCGQHQLSAFCPWARFPDAIHTPGRCGRYLEVRVDMGQLFSRPRLTVWWPDAEQPREWIGR